MSIISLQLRQKLASIEAGQQGGSLTLEEKIARNGLSAHWLAILGGHAPVNLLSTFLAGGCFPSSRPAAVE
jgi:hypothetical protein